jgi:uncharacterized protein
MKTKLLLAVGMVLILVMVGLAGCSSQAGQSTTQPITVNMGNQQTGIWVNGEGKITVTPDLATITLGVATQSETVAEATAKAADAMQKVIASLKINDVSAKDIQTQNYSIQQVTRWDDKNQQQIVIGYSVSNTVVAKVRNLDKIGTTIDAVAEAGGDLTRINGINFSVENPDQYYVQARELAMKDAKAKADQIAKLSGVTLGKVTYVTENSYVPVTYPVMYKDSMAAGASSSTPITAGQTDVTLTVQVNYTIQ